MATCVMRYVGPTEVMTPPSFPSIWFEEGNADVMAGHPPTPPLTYPPPKKDGFNNENPMVDKALDLGGRFWKGGG